VTLLGESKSVTSASLPDAPDNGILSLSSTVINPKHRWAQRRSNRRAAKVLDIAREEDWTVIESDCVEDQDTIEDPFRDDAAPSSTQHQLRRTVSFADDINVDGDKFTPEEKPVRRKKSFLTPFRKCVGFIRRRKAGASARKASSPSLVSLRKSQGLVLNTPPRSRTTSGASVPSTPKGRMYVSDAIQESPRSRRSLKRTPTWMSAGSFASSKSRDSARSALRKARIRSRQKAVRILGTEVMAAFASTPNLL